MRQGDSCEEGDWAEGEAGRAEQASRGATHSFVLIDAVSEMIQTGCQIEPGEASEGGDAAVVDDDQWIGLNRLQRTSDSNLAAVVQNVTGNCRSFVYALWLLSCLKYHPTGAIVPRKAHKS